MTVPGIVVLAMLLSAGPVTGQVAEPDSGAPSGPKTEPEWALSASVFTYFTPDRNYLQPTFTADRGPLHLQLRYNYENHETGSAWIGYKFQAGSGIELEFTPAVGGVFGKTDGIAPGWSFSLGYRRLKLYSESEYLFDLNSKSDNFFYTWSELTYSIKDWLRAGLAAQRTRAYQTDVDVQRGLTAGVAFGNLDLAAYVLNLDREKQTYIFSIAVSF